MKGVKLSADKKDIQACGLVFLLPDICRDGVRARKPTVMKLTMLKTINVYPLALLAIFTLTISGCSFQKPDYLKMISPAELKKLMQAEDVFLVDVHTPRQRHIKGTDLFIPYSKVEQHIDKLPSDKSAAIYLYCAGGPMGNAAARTLHDLGFSNLSNLEGGAHAWRKAGYASE